MKGLLLSYLIKMKTLSELIMRGLTREIGDICISCTILPVLGLVAATSIIYYIIQLFI